jgi:hypothetical protein
VPRVRVLVPAVHGGRVEGGDERHLRGQRE